MGHCLFSLVVDRLPKHFFEAEVLLFTLLRIGKVKPDQVLVNCVEGVSADFTDYVQAQGHLCRTIAPYLDRACCNKLQQLENIAPFLQGADGVVLLDTDTVILAPPELPDRDVVSGKIVDGPNPPLQVLTRIFAEAGITAPATVACDWSDELTLATNFNGGFLYIPTSHVAAVSTQWRRFAEWLHAHPGLFESPKQKKHVDQVAMALTLGTIPSCRLPANANFPTHREMLPKSFDPAEPVRMLHHHGQFDAFGLLAPRLTRLPAVNQAVEIVNQSIADRGRFEFFGTYREDVVARASRNVNRSWAPIRAKMKHSALGNRRIRLVLHAGTPKTGTTSLQVWLHSNRNEIRAEGILYPGTVRPGKVPKHQWVSGLLLAEKLDEWVERFGASIDEAGDEIHSILLSTEGIFNHWWDFRPPARDLLASLGGFFEIEVWTWFRQPEDFANSYYRQCIANPRMNFTGVYGGDLSIEEALSDAWFRRHLDYLGFHYDIEATFGTATSRAIRHRGNTVTRALELLGLKDMNATVERQNQGMGEAGVKLTRMINQHQLAGAARKEAMKLAKTLDRLFGGQERPFVLPNQARATIARLTALGNSEIEAVLI